MKIMAIDYGRKKIGLALATTPLAEPYGVIRLKVGEDVSDKIAQVVQAERVDKVVVGISEGKMAEETKKFGERLKEKLKIPIFFQDETLTTYEAQQKAIKAKIKRVKRKKLEDAYAAAEILQQYMDQNRKL